MELTNGRKLFRARALRRVLAVIFITVSVDHLRK